MVESYKHPNVISCFLLVAGVNIFINSKLRVCGLAEIPLSNLNALDHPHGRRAPRDPAEVQSCGWRAVGHHHFRAVYAGCCQGLVVLLLLEYFLTQKMYYSLMSRCQVWANVLLLGCPSLGTQRQGRHCPSPRWKSSFHPQEDGPEKVRTARMIKLWKKSHQLHCSSPNSYTVVLNLGYKLESPAEL